MTYDIHVATMQTLRTCPCSISWTEPPIGSAVHLCVCMQIVRVCQSPRDIIQIRAQQSQIRASRYAIVRARSAHAARICARCNNGTTPALLAGMDDAIKADLADRIESLTSTIAALLAQGRVDSAAAAIEMRDAQIDALARVIEGR